MRALLGLSNMCCPPPPFPPTTPTPTLTHSYIHTNTHKPCLFLKANGNVSDVVPWQCWTRYPEHCSSSLFVDVDFAELARRKRQVILETPELVSQLAEVQTHEDELYPNLLLRSKSYHLVGCDLRQSAVLQQALSSILDPNECIFLFLAEVSITYMETHSADALIQWASSLGQGKPTKTRVFQSAC